MCSSRLYPGRFDRCTGIDDETNYNINADIAASKLAVALGAKKLILLTDVRGLMLDVNDPDSVIHRLKVSEVPSWCVTA